MVKEDILNTHEKMGQESFLTQLKYLQALQDYIDKKVDENVKSSQEEPYQSKDTNELNTALAKAQGSFPKIRFNRENPYFKNRYADLDVIVHSVKPMMEKNGLSFTQEEHLCDDGSVILYTILRHSSGQWTSSRSRIIPKKGDDQSFGSSLTYRKRYSFTSLLGITTTEDPSDDDAELSVFDLRDARSKGVALNTKYNPNEESGSVITKEQLEEIEYELGNYDDIAEMVLTVLKIQSLADMPKSKFLVSINRIREIKNAREGH